MVDEIEVSENKEALIVLAGTVAGAATSNEGLPILERQQLTSLLQQVLLIWFCIVKA